MFPVRLAVLMASIFALSPLAIDLYLPTFPAIAGSFDAPSRAVAITVSIYILGLSLGQFLGGPWSDYRGRRPVLLAGLALFCLASVVLALSRELDIFWAARFVQAVGGGLASVVIPAMVRDCTEGQETAKLFTLIALIMIVAPAIAPALGTLLFMLAGWRSIFFFLAVYAALVALLSWRYLHVRARSPAVQLGQNLLSRYRHVLGNTTAMRYLLCQGLCFGVMLTFLANASLVYIEQYGASEILFSGLFAANIATIAFFNRVNNHLLQKVPAARVLVLAIALQCAACLALLAVTALTPPLWLVVPLVMLAVGALGGIMGNSQACMLQFFPDHSGIAAALLGSGQYMVASLISGLSTRFQSAGMWPMTVTMAVTALIALAVVPSPKSVAVE